jgi:hypothetical protein
MNSNGLAKLYDRLTPWERLSLILAASARGDEQERNRLAQSAPRLRYEVADYCGLAQAWREVAWLHFMEVQELAGLFFAALALARSPEKETAERMRETLSVFGYLLQVKLAGWRQFCQEHHADPELCWSMLPGFELIQMAEQTAATAAFTTEGVSEWMERKGKVPAKPVTAEAVAASLRAVFNTRAEWWG